MKNPFRKLTEDERQQREQARQERQDWEDACRRGYVQVPSAPGRPPTPASLRDNQRGVTVMDLSGSDMLIAELRDRLKVVQAENEQLRAALAATEAYIVQQENALLRAQNELLQDIFGKTIQGIVVFVTELRDQVSDPELKAKIDALTAAWDDDQP